MLSRLLSSRKLDEGEVKSHTSRSGANSNLRDESTTFIWMKETKYKEQGSYTLSRDRESVYSAGIPPQVQGKCLADLTATMSGILRLEGPTLYGAGKYKLHFYFPGGVPTADHAN